MGRLYHKTADPRTSFVTEKIFGVKFGAPILSEDHTVTVMRHLWGLSVIGALVLSLAIMPDLRQPLTALVNRNDKVIFEMGKSNNVLGNSIGEYRKAFMDLSGVEAIHIGYVMLAPDSNPRLSLFSVHH